MDNSYTEKELLHSIRDGADIKGLMNQSGWKLLIQTFEEEALDSWFKLESVDPMDTEKIYMYQNDVKLIKLLLSRAHDIIADADAAEQALRNGE